MHQLPLRKLYKKSYLSSVSTLNLFARTNIQEHDHKESV